MLGMAIHHGYEESIEIIVDLIVARRQELQQLVHTEVPSYPADPNRDQIIRADKVLDEYADTAYNLLEENSVLIPRRLRSPYDGKTIYHCSYLSWKIVDFFWDTGFRDVDAFSDRGTTPLMTLYDFRFRGLREQLELVCWFVSKGGNVYQRQNRSRLFRYEDAALMDPPVETIQTGSGIAAVHFVARGLGNIIMEKGEYRFDGEMITCLRSLKRQIASLDDSFIAPFPKSYFTNILSDLLVDACTCQCSAGGCVPYLHLLKQFSYRYLFKRVLGVPGERIFQEWRLQIIICLVRFLTDQFGKAHPMWSRFLAAVIRFLTFEKLELRHTCCRTLGFSEPTDIVLPEESEEIDEIHDEDKFRFELLEELLQEFMAK